MKARKLVVLFLSIFILGLLVSAQCSEEQIDVNTASKGELVKIYQIGDARAEQLISLRPFNSVDDLIRIQGIGETRIQQIKEQGLACVDFQEEVEGLEEPVENMSYEIPVIEKISETKPETLDTISLNPKDIKSENSFSGKGNSYAVYGFVALSVLVGILFLVQKNKYKNEFGR